tara:strand:- start:1222 stop:1719 length:498 start_codon:yes stop_codon:yes gene_type:complete
MGFTRIGKVSKHRGLKGDLIIKIFESFNLNFDSIDTIYIEIENSHIPFLIKKAKKINNKKFIFLLKNHESRESNEILINNYISINDKEAENFLNEIEKLIEYRLIEDKKEIGKIKDYIFNDQPIVICDIKDKEVMVPYVKEYFFNVNHKEKLVAVKIPKDLINLN